MTDLASVADQVLIKGQQVQAIEKSKQVEGQLGKRRQVLVELVASLTSIRELEAQWLQEGLPALTDAGYRSAQARARDRIAATQAAYASDPAALLDDNAFRILVRFVEQVVTAAGSAITAAWVDYAREAIPPALGADEQLLRADPRVEPSLVDTLVKWDHSLRTIAAKPIPISTDLREFHQIVASRRELWSSVSIEHDPEVVEFIRACGDKGAPLALLTSKVETWLTEKDLIDTYVIRKRD